MANDLRYVIALLKINNDLERIADLASKIAEQTELPAEEEPLSGVPFDLTEMSQRVKTILRMSLNALLKVDAGLAQSLCDLDNEVDEIHRNMYECVEQHLRMEPAMACQWVTSLGTDCGSRRQYW